MLFVRSFLFAICLYVLTFAQLFLLPVALLYRPLGFGVARYWSAAVLWCLKIICGVHIQIEGQVPTYPAIIAMKHQSTIETLCLHPILYRPMVIVKRELLWIPIFGWYLRVIDSIAIIRKNKVQAMKSIVAQAQKRAGGQRSVVIFPQGTRVPVGQKKPYFSGVVLLAQSLDWPLVPVALNSGLAWPKGSFIKRPGTVILRFLPPLPKSDQPKELMKNLENVIESNSDELAQKF